MATVREFAARVVFELMGSERDRFNILDTPLNPPDTQLTCQMAIDSGVGGVGIGTWLEIDHEIMWVSAIQGTTIHVYRGRRLTGPQSHALGELIRIDPRFPRAAVRDAMKDEIRSWNRRLFRVGEEHFAVAAGTGPYTFAWTPVDDLQVLDIWLVPSDSTVVAGYGAWYRDPIRSLRLRGSVRNGQVDSRQLVITQPIPYDGTIAVSYAQRFALDEFEPETDLVTQVGIDPDWERILFFGTMAQLMAPTEGSRSSLQGIGESRRDEGVPAGAAVATAREYQRLRDRALSEAVGTLRVRYPIRSS